MIEMQVDAGPAVARLEAVSQRLRANTRDAMEDGVERLLAIVQGKLSGEVLNSRSGALLHSIRAESVNATNGIEARIFSDGSVPYARVQEYGGRLNIPAIAPVRAKVLAFAYEGRMIFAKSVTAHVVDIPERSYMRASLDEFEAACVEGIRQSVADALG
jgi:hypothetical protein